MPEGKRGGSAPGERRGGRQKGTQNKVTTEFKQALNDLLEASAPKMQQWLDKVAEIDPGKALDHITKLAEYAHPKLARSDITAKVKSQARLIVETVPHAGD